MIKATSGKDFECNLCPNACKSPRANGRTGLCGAPHEITVAYWHLHKWEEPPLSGSRGSGTVFFSCCTMRCVFCQNKDISRSPVGKTYTPKEFSELIKSIEASGAHNVNLVSPTPFADLIAEALEIYKPKIPVVYNTSGYETVDTLKMLDGLVDVYLPDLKYVNEEYSQKYSGTKNYFKFAFPAISEMIRQVGKPVYDSDGIMQKGVIVRHLVLPNNLQNTFDVLDCFSKHFKNDALLSLMGQYTPVDTESYPEINRPLKPLEYKRAVLYMEKLGITDGFTQDLGSVGESFIPDFSKNSY